MASDNDIDIALLKQAVKDLQEEIEEIKKENDDFRSKITYGKGMLKVITLLGTFVGIVWTVFTFGYNNLHK